MTTRAVVCARRLPLLALCVLFLQVQEHAPAHAAALVPGYAGIAARNLRLQALLDAAVRAGLPGVSLQVTGPGIDFEGTAGVANQATGEPFTAHHVMYVASLGKTFTAVVALQLCAERQLELDVPITTWLPAAVTVHIPSSEQITLRHLLTHTSGLPDYLNDDTAWLTDFTRDPGRLWTHRDLIPYIQDRPLLFRPGRGFHYSNSNYILVGWILERVTGQPLHKLVRRRILVPLGLKHTFNGKESAGIAARVHGYIRRGSRIIDTTPWYDHYGLADAGIHSTAGELARFFRALLATDRLLSWNMHREMTHVDESVRSHSRYGISIFVQRDTGGGKQWYSNNGVDPGYHADMLYFPDQDLTVVLLANASQGQSDLLYEQLLSAVVRVAL